MEKELEQALVNFRQSVHAWSEAAYIRPLPVAVAARRHNWRPAAAWALGCVLAAGSVAGGLYDRHYRQQQAAMQAARQQQLAVELLRAKQTDETLLAAVDSDVSRQVPSAMEPLAQLMDEYASQ